MSEHLEVYRKWCVANHGFDPFAELEVAAHARGKIEGRKMQAEEDAQLVPLVWPFRPDEVAAAIRSAAAKIGDDNDQS